MTVGIRTQHKTAKRGRPIGNGFRQRQFLTLVELNPGIKTGQIAKIMGITSKYAGNIGRDLRMRGVIEKQRDSLFPITGPQNPAEEKPTTETAPVQNGDADEQKAYRDGYRHGYRDGAQDAGNPYWP